jgi:hypothetical protein
MIQLPVRVELRDRSSDRSCSFTIHEDFLDYPVKGDHIIIPDGYLSVAGRFHFCRPDEDAALMVATSPYLVEKYDDMLKLLDWFKGQYKIDDFTANSEPASYYSFYRSAMRLLGWKMSQRAASDNMGMKLFSAAAAAVLVAEDLRDQEPTSDEYGQVYGDNSPHIEGLLQVVLDKKQENEDEIDLLGVIKIWEPTVNSDGAIHWEASEEQVLQAAKFIFGRLKSIPSEMMPDGLK